jgi:hypothetical protein
LICTGASLERMDCRIIGRRYPRPERVA